MTDRTFVDTNVWVCAVDAADPAKRDRALEILGPAVDVDLVISTQVLTEFYVVATRKLSPAVPAVDAAAMVEQLSRLPVVAVDAALVRTAVTGSMDWGVSIWDALILSAADAAGCRVVLSEDIADGQRYGSVVVENPFRDAS